MHADAALPGVSTEPLTVQVPRMIDHDTEPAPVPPDVVSVNDCPYVAEVDVTVSVDWAARLTVTVNEEDVTAR